MSSKTILITGATNGIGRQTALELTKLGHTIVFNARDMTRGQKVAEDLKIASGNNNIFTLECDLSSFDSIKKFATEFATEFERLDVLINNAGTWEKEYSKTVDGIETTFAVNHLAPFLLTNLLLPKLKASTPARIINVSSALHSGKINFEDIEFERSFVGLVPYTQSKLANILFTNKLARELKGSGVTVNSLHPGIIRTAMTDKVPWSLRGIRGMFPSSIESSASTSVYLANSSEVDGVTGKYFEKCKQKDSGDYSNNIQIQDKLWEISEIYIQKA